MVIFASVSIVVLALLAPTLYGFVIGAPIFFSPRAATREALARCRLKKGELFFDLGMGTGRTMVIAANEFGARAVGFELSPILLVVAKINLFLRGVKGPVLRLKNFYHEDLGQADVVFCFLTPPAMARLKPKFERELKPGARVVSYAFKIEGWDPQETIRENYPGKVYIYKMK